MGSFDHFCLGQPGQARVGCELEYGQVEKI